MALSAVFIVGVVAAVFVGVNIGGHIDERVTEQLEEVEGERTD